MTLISKIYGLLLSNKISLLKYIGITFLTGLIPAFCLAALVFTSADLLGLKYSDLPKINISWESFWIAVVISPFLESYLLILTLHVLRSLKFEGLKLAIIAAIFWGTLHGVQSWPWFFAPTWIFFIYSTAYETWRLTAFKKAFIVIALPHALNNLFVVLISGFDS
jgi:hypothetical protein